MADVPIRANPSTEAYERARKVVHAWLATLHSSVVIPEDDGGQLIDSLARAIDEAMDSVVDEINRPLDLRRRLS